MGGPILEDPGAEKATLRAGLRSLRRGVADPAHLSQQICTALMALDLWSSAPLRVMLYTAIPGEPDLRAVADWRRAQGDQVVLPEESPEPESVDLVILPGLGFTRAGARLGQGGGWYDRFLAQTRADCVRVGVAFGVQVLDRLPVEDHDVAMHHVVTEAGCVTHASR